MKANLEKFRDEVHPLMVEISLIADEWNLPGMELTLVMRRPGEPGSITFSSEEDGGLDALRHAAGDIEERLATGQAVPEA